MNWWNPSSWFERRESMPFTDSLVSAILAEAAGASTSKATGTAALEGCVALYAAGFAAAKVDAPPMIAGALTADVRALIARNLMRRGEAMFLIEVMEGLLKLRPCGSWDVRGGDDPASWFVRGDLFGPSGNRTVFRSHASFVHVRYAMDPARPWHGIDPLGWAVSTGALAGRLESGLANEAAAAAALLLAVPSDGGDGGEDTDPLATLKKDIAGAKGKPVLVETTSSGWGQGAGQAPQRDWRAERLGPNWPDTLNVARRQTAEAVAAACNVPFVLLDSRAEGTSQREALRRFETIGLEPLGRIVEQELSEKLGAPVRFDFGPLMAGDLAGKARAVKGLVDAGIPLADAVAVSGLMVE